MKKSVGLIVVLVLAVMLSQAYAEVFSVVVDKDNWVKLDRGSTNYGSVGYFCSSVDAAVPDKERGIIHFDLSAYAGQQAGDATLTLTTIAGGISGQTKGQPIDIYSIHSANASWGEMTSSNNYRNVTLNEGWVGSDGTGWFNGLGNPGDAYGATPVATGIIPSWGGGATVVTIPAAVVQSWIDNPSDNAGLLVRLQDESRAADWVGWCSREGATPPTLTFGSPNLAPLATVEVDSVYKNFTTNPSYWGKNLNDGNLNTAWLSNINDDYTQNKWNHWITFTWPNGKAMIESITMVNPYYYGTSHANLAPRVFDIEMWNGSAWIAVGSYTKTGANVTREYVLNFTDVFAEAIRINISVPTGDAYDYIHGLNQVEGTRDYSVYNYDQWLAAPQNEQFEPGFNALGNELGGATDQKPAQLSEILITGQLISGFLAGDINKDCYVDFEDFAMLSLDWLKCNNPTDEDCN